jgi:hypothetical protein
VTRTLIIVQGLATVVMCLIAFPLGAVLVVVNGVLAIVARGTNRRLFAGFAIAGAAICLVIAFFAVGASVSGEVGTSTKLS